jgi:hypothetical protein
VSVPVEVVGGVACVTLPAGRKKVPTRYQVRAVGSVGGWRSWTVQQAEADDPEGEHAHTVGTDGERWRCTCADWTFRADRHERPCKHIRACREVVAFIKALTGVEQ